MEVSVHENSSPKSLYLRTQVGEYLIREGDLRKNIHLLNDQELVREVKEQLTVMNQEQLQRAGEHLIEDYETPMGLCTSCSMQNHLVPESDWGCPKGSYVYNMCSTGSSECPECGEQNSLEVHRSSGDSATKSTVYRCKECGNKIRGITTG